METTTFPAKAYLGIETKNAGMDQMKTIFDQGYAKIAEYAEQNSIQFIGPPVGLYTDYNPVDQSMTTVPGIEVAPGTTVPVDSGLVVIELAEGNALHHQHIGSYDGLKDAHDVMTKKLEEDSLNMGKYAIEVYITDPMQEQDESKWVTDIYYQLV